jgi:hypothetical protein
MIRDEFFNMIKEQPPLYGMNALDDCLEQWRGNLAAKIVAWDANPGNGGMAVPVLDSDILCVLVRTKTTVDVEVYQHGKQHPDTFRFQCISYPSSTLDLARRIDIRQRAEFVAGQVTLAIRAQLLPRVESLFQG